MNWKITWGCFLMLCVLPEVARSQANVDLSITSGLTISEVAVTAAGRETLDTTAPSPLISALPAENSLMTVTQSTSLRRGPGASFLVIKRLHPGCELQPIGDFGQKYWMNVRYADTTGWVKKALLKDLEVPIEEASRDEEGSLSASSDLSPDAGAFSTTAALTIGPDYSGLPPFAVYRETSMREQPENGSKTIKRLPKGAKVKVIDPRTERLWTKIQYQGQIGWARKELLDPVE